MVPGLTYRAFPHLFWDLDPDAPVNVRHPVVFRRVLEHGSTADLRALIEPDTALALLPALALPEHLHRFWSEVFGRAASTQP